MPSGASIEHMETRVLVNKQQVTFHLLIEGIWELGVASIAGTRFGPLSANTTRLDHFWDQVQYFL